MKWIIIKTMKDNDLLVKEDDIARIIIDPSTEEGVLTLNNSCVTYDIKGAGLGNYLCRMSAARPLPDWDPEILRKEIADLRETIASDIVEIQDLKLENDRLNQKYNLLYNSLTFLCDCGDTECTECPMLKYDCDEIVRFLKKYFTNINKKLEDL